MTLQNALATLLKTPKSQSSFSALRHMAAGTPSLWEETIAITQEKQQSYIRVRSQADEGGAPIGVWQARANESMIIKLANALQDSPFFTSKNDAVEPGEEQIIWIFKIDDEEQKLCTVAGSNLVQEMSILDLSFRRLANELVKSKQGAALICELDLNRGQASLFNQGNQSGIIVNSFYASMTDTTFFRIEAGAVPQEKPGISSTGIEYRPIPIRLPISFDTPFDQQFIQIKAGERLLLPGQVSLHDYKNHYVRAVYSNYGEVQQSLDYPIIRGRVFSLENKL